MKFFYIALTVVAVAAFIAVGLMFAQGPQPEIVLPAEIITKVGPLNISNTLITSWVVMLFIIGFTFIATRSMKLMPGGLQNFVEAVVDFLLSQIEEIAGKEKGRKFFILCSTIFLYLIVSNWFGLLPFFNAIGKTEDVGHHVFHELSSPEPHDLELTEEGTYLEGEKFAGWKMEGSDSLVYTKSGAKAVDFEVHAGETPAEAADRYYVFLAKEFAGLEVEEEELEHPSPQLVERAAAALNGQDAPLLIFADGGAGGEGAEGEGEEHAEEGEEHAEEGEAHGIESPALHRVVEGVSFEESQKFALVIPFFRGTFSDVNNTIAIALISFVMIEFWGIQTLGFAYFGKFFNFSGVIPAFVGLLELISEFIRIVSFAFRLFGNILAGEVLVVMITFLMPFLLVDIIYGLELFVGFIQAAVFALLTLVFAVMATESHAEHDDEHGHGAEPHTEGTAQAHH